MNAITRRFTATASHAETSVRYNGPATSAPEQHKAFPHQANTPKPGTAEHHRHQNNS